MQQEAKSATKIALGASILVLFFALIILVTSANGVESKENGDTGEQLEPDLVPEHGEFADELLRPVRRSVHGVLASPFKTAPADLPTFTVTTGDGETGDGYIFMAYFNYWQLSQSAYLLILEDDGEPVYYKQLAPVPIGMDFKKQPNGLLTYYPQMGASSFHALDDSYKVVRTYKAGNGYVTDFHDLQVLENGNALIMIHDQRTIDMSQVVEGGDPQATVIGCTIQEIDSDMNVVFEWQSWDHIPFEDSNQPLTDKTINYMNCNSLELDDDGNILLSSRHLDEVTKINRQNGEIIWRLGGKANDFDFPEGIRFNYAHDARRLNNGHITIFDNGVAHSPPTSRGVEYAVDEVNMTVSKVREFRHEPDLYSRALGNMQRLPNGNTLIGWGRSIDIPVFTEFDAGGEAVLEFRTTPGHGSYRVFRFPWQGYPTWPAALAVDEQEGTVKLYFSWNGSTETAAYLVYGGKNRDQLQFLATAAKEGFETTFEYAVPGNGLWYFQVIPVDGAGALGQASMLVPAAVGNDPIYLPLIGGG